MRISDWSSDVCSSDLPSGWPSGSGLPDPDVFQALLLFTDNKSPGDLHHEHSVPTQTTARLPGCRHAGGCRQPRRCFGRLSGSLDIGRASCRERVGQSVENTVVAGSLKKKKTQK